MDTVSRRSEDQTKRGYQLPPALPSVLNVLVAGHRNERLEAGKADIPAIRDRLNSTINDIGRAAAIAFGARPYSRVAPHLIRIITGATTGTDGLAESIIATRPDGLGLRQTRPLTAYSAAEEEPTPGWLVEYAVAARDEEAVARADVVVVVWDGHAPEGFLGGTVRIIQKAAIASKALVWIDLTGRCRLLDRTLLTAAVLLSLHTIETDPVMIQGLFVDCNRDELERQVREALAPEVLFGLVSKRDPAIRLVAEYFAPRHRSWNDRRGGSIDAFLTALVSLDLSRASSAARRLVIGEDPHPWLGSLMPKDMRPLVALEQFFIWSDAQASVAAGRRRSSVWVIAICSFLAVFLSALGIVVGSAWPGGAFWLPIFEFVPIAVTLALFAIHRLQGVHRYWLFHRWLAEQLRFQRIVAPLDALHPALLRGVWIVPNPSPVDGRTGKNGELELQAQDWLVQRILAAEDFDLADNKAAEGSLGPWLDEATASVAAGIADQERYHVSKAATFHDVHRRMDLLAVSAFAITGVAVLGHLILGVEWTIVLTTALPTAGAAMTGIADQLEAARISRQSERAATVLESYRLALEATRRRDTGGKSWREVWKLLEARRVAQDAVRLMALETDDWRAVLSHRELRLG